MPKRVFQPMEVFETQTRVLIEPPKIIIKKETEEEDTGPTREEIEEQNRQLIQEAEVQANEIIENAKAEAEKIIKEAEEGAFYHIKKATEKAKKIEDEARQKAEKYFLQKKEEIDEEIAKQRENLEKEREETKQQAYKEGYEAGYKSGRDEVERLIHQLHIVIEGAIDKRDTIIADAEEQIIRIILLIARKVVKAISEEEKQVVIENIKAALEKIKGKAEVIIRVNTEDLELATEHKEELMQIFEELKHVTILEDTRVDKGGCIIETDFGSVDARIATQLAEIEERIRELANLPYFKVQKELKEETGRLKEDEVESIEI